MVRKISQHFGLYSRYSAVYGWQHFCVAHHLEAGCVAMRKLDTAQTCKVGSVQCGNVQYGVVRPAICEVGSSCIGCVLYARVEG